MREDTETKPATDEEIATIRRTIGPRYDHAFGGTAGEVRALIDRIDAERERADEAEDRVEELERDSEKVAAEFEGDATKTLGKLAEEFDETFHEWSEIEDGWTVDDAAQAIYDGRADLLRQITAYRERAEKAEEEAETIGTLSRIARETSAAQLAEAQQQIAALREALKPFADAANELFQSDEDDGALDWVVTGNLTVGHLRRANEAYYPALAQTEGAEG